VISEQPENEQDLNNDITENFMPPEEFGDYIDVLHNADEDVTGEAPESFKIIYSREQLREVGNRIYWSTLIEVENTGDTPIEFRMSGYDLTDENGELLAVGGSLMVSHFPSILYPGEKGLFIDSTEIVGIDINTKVIFTPRWDIRTPRRTVYAKIFCNNNQSKGKPFGRVVISFS